MLPFFLSTGPIICELFRAMSGVVDRVLPARHTWARQKESIAFMASKELEFAEKRMQQKWYELVMAEQQGAVVQVLERMYTSYVLAVEVYNRCLADEQRVQGQVSIPVPAPALSPRKSARKAS